MRLLLSNLRHRPHRPPLWNIPVFFLYKMRRVTCPEHGIIVESVPWSDGKHSQTIEQRQFLANLARRLSWPEVIKAYLMTEDFERFWEYKSAYWAGRFLDAWCTRAMRSKIELMKKFVGLVRRHRELRMNWFRSQGLSSGVVEGFNNRVKLTAKKAYGFRTFESLQIALFHALGRLPEQKGTHRFW